MGDVSTAANVQNPKDDRSTSAVSDNIVGSSGDLPEPDREGSNSKVLDLSTELWVEQFNSYLNGKAFSNDPIPDDPRPLKVRAMAVGLEEFDNLASDGGITKLALENQLEVYPFSSLDPLALQVLLGNFELVDELGKKDSQITRAELAQLSERGTNLRTLPSSEAAPVLSPEVTKWIDDQRGKTEAIINKRIEKFPTHSPKDSFDTAVKGMAKAILNGDVETFNKMVEEFGSHKPLLERASKKLDYLLYPAGVRVRFADSKVGARMILAAKDGTSICFSPTNSPVTSDLRRSPADVMTLLGRVVSASGDTMTAHFTFEDRNNQAKAEEKKLIDGLVPKLDAGEAKILQDLLSAARLGEMPEFNKVLSTALRVDSNRAHNVANALNQIVGDGDIRFSVTNERGTVARMQIRNRAGDKSLTITSRNDLIVGSNGIRDASDADTVAEAVGWVYKSIKAGRDSSSEKLSVELAKPPDPFVKENSMTGFVYDVFKPATEKPDFWQQRRQALGR